MDLAYIGAGACGGLGLALIQISLIHSWLWKRKVRKIAMDRLNCICYRAVDWRIRKGDEID